MPSLLAALILAAAPAWYADDPPTTAPALASWYDDAGQTASGRHYPNGFAALTLGNDWGRRVAFTYHGRTATGRLDDHGPYVAGRTFDLGPSLKAALGCPDLCQLRYRVVRGRADG